MSTNKNEDVTNQLLLEAQRVTMKFHKHCLKLAIENKRHKQENEQLKREVDHWMNKYVKATDVIEKLQLKLMQTRLN